MINIISKLNIFVGVLLITITPTYFYVSAQLQPTIITSNSLPVTQTERESNILDGNLGIRGNLGGANTLKAIKVTGDGHLKIESIGIDAKIYEGADSSALEKGIWRMPEHGTPDNQVSDQPVVLAGHRWGQNDFTYEYRSKNLFLNLPSLSRGDVIEVTWNGVTYKYAVTDVQKNNYVEKLSDLILITCVDYVSTTRYFVYAERI